MSLKIINRCLFCKYIKSIFNNALLGYCVNTLTKLTEAYCAITTHFSWRKVDSLWSSHRGLNNIKSISSWSVKAHLQILFFNKVLKLDWVKKKFLHTVYNWQELMFQLMWHYAFNLMKSFKLNYESVECKNYFATWY
jgi:hypothetical protein